MHFTFTFLIHVFKVKYTRSRIQSQTVADGKTSSNAEVSLLAITHKLTSNTKCEIVINDHELRVEQNKLAGKSGKLCLSPTSVKQDFL